MGAVPIESQEQCDLVLFPWIHWNSVSGLCACGVTGVVWLGTVPIQSVEQGWCPLGITGVVRLYAVTMQSLEQCSSVLCP